MSDATAQSPGARFPLTAIILTYNEAENIGDCLRSLDWVEDVVIVDSFSKDATVDEARRARPGVRVFTNPFEDFGQQRNWAIEHTEPRHSWILFLDADERSNEPFAAAVRESVNNPGERVGFYLCYRNMFLGRWIKHSTLYPSWQLRLFKRGRLTFRKEGHGQREVTDGPLDYIRQPYDHYGFSKGIADWIARHNRYSSAEVELVHRLRQEPLRLGDLFARDAVVRRRTLKRIAARAGFRPLARFFYLYVLRRGFLDGRAGLLFCLLRAAHEIHITVKLAEAAAAKSAAPSHVHSTASTAPPPDARMRQAAAPDQA